MIIIHDMNNSTAPLPRILEAIVVDSLRRFPVVVVTGARQTGKSTLVCSGKIAEGRTYRSFDDYDVLERAQARPDLLLEEAVRLTLDEVQRVPEVLLAIKRDVDRPRTAGRFLLTGSANLLMMRRVSESLAGRAVYLALWPMTEAEKGANPHPGPWSDWLEAADARSVRTNAGNAVEQSDWVPRVLSGGYPVPALTSDPIERAQWFEGYVRTYLERDLQGLAAITSLADFRRLMWLAAHRVGQVLNQSELARDASLPQATAHRYLNLLETSCQIVRIPAFASSRTRRLVKSPRLYWTDTGLAAHLAGIHPQGAAPPSDVPGALLENLVLTQLLAWRETVVPQPGIHYWRTHSGLEVDFVIEAGRRVLPVEVRATSRVRPEDTRGLVAFLDDHRQSAVCGILLYGGEEVVLVSDRIVAVPLGHLW